MSLRPPPRRSGAALLATLLVASAACNPPAPTASPTLAPTSTPAQTTEPSASQASAAEAYARIRRDVEAIRGLRPTADVDPVTIDEAQLRTNLEAEFESEMSAADLRFSEQELIALGLLPAGSSLRDVTLDLQSGQVAGYYSPNRNELFVVSRSGRVGALEQVTYAHEFTHQLQDQNFDLDKLGLDAVNQSDRGFARLALIEGDAVSVQTAWTATNLTPEELGELLAASLDPEGLAALQRAPAYLRETALFPYQDGLALVYSLFPMGGYDAINAAFADPPASTEQVLHPEKYAGHEAPIDVEVPKTLATSLGSGWAEIGQDTLGELILRIWLRESGVTTADARAAAAGWGGDRLALLRGGAGGRMGVGLVTEWDSVADAEEFAAAAKTAISDGAPHGKVIYSTARPRTVFVGIGDFADDIADALAAIVLVN